MFEIWHNAENIKIRARYIPRIVSQRDLAKEYGVNQKVIWAIVNNKNWRTE